MIYCFQINKFACFVLFCCCIYQTFDEAIAEFDTLGEDSYKDSTLITIVACLQQCSSSIHLIHRRELLLYFVLCDFYYVICDITLCYVILLWTPLIYVICAMWFVILICVVLYYREYHWFMLEMLLIVGVNRFKIVYFKC